MRLYHISDNPNLTTLIPRVPRNNLIGWLEDDTYKRISFAPTISLALRGIGKTIYKKTLYVYMPIGINNKFLYKPSVKQVPDADITHEVWYLRPVNVKLVEVIRGGRREKRENWFIVHSPKDKNNIKEYVFSSDFRYKTIKKLKHKREEFEPKAGRLTLAYSRFLNRKK